MRVRQLMSTDLETLKSDDMFKDADVMMRLRRVRHLPVTDDAQRLVGLVTHRDLLKVGGDGARVDAIMTRDVQTCSPDTPALAAARKLLRGKFGCLPVVEGDVLVGIVTEADFVRWAVEELGSLH